MSKQNIFKEFNQLIEEMPILRRGAKILFFFYLSERIVLIGFVIFMAFFILAEKRESSSVPLNLALFQDNWEKESRRFRGKNESRSDTLIQKPLEDFDESSATSSQGTCKKKSLTVLEKVAPSSTLIHGPETSFDTFAAEK